MLELLIVPRRKYFCVFLIFLIAVLIYYIYLLIYLFINSLHSTEFLKYFSTIHYNMNTSSFNTLNTLKIHKELQAYAHMHEMTRYPNSCVVTLAA